MFRLKLNQKGRRNQGCNHNLSVDQNRQHHDQTINKIRRQIELIKGKLTVFDMESSELKTNCTNQTFVGY